MIQGLPEELIISIFSYLPFEEFLQLPSLSHYIKKVNYHPQAWKLINLGNHPTGRINQVLKEDRFKKKKHLYIFNLGSTSDCLFIPNAFRERFNQADFIFL